MESNQYCSVLQCIAASSKANNLLESLAPNKWMNWLKPREAHFQKNARSAFFCRFLRRATLVARRDYVHGYDYSVPLQPDT